MLLLMEEEDLKEMFPAEALSALVAAEMML